MSLQNFHPAILSHADGNTVFRLRKAVLCLILVLVAVTPLLQLHSLDQFPVATDDIEIQAIYCVLTLGMLLVAALTLTFIPVLRLWRLFVPPARKPMWSFLSVDSEAEDESPPPFAVPLRI